MLPLPLLVLSWLCAAPSSAPQAVLVTMVDPGRPPHRVLRLEPVAGEARQVVLLVDSEVELETVGERRTEYGPELSLPLTVSVQPEGEGTRYHLSVGRPQVQAAQGDEGAETAWQLAVELASLQGRSGTILLGPTGVVREGSLPLGLLASPVLSRRVRAVLSSDWYALPHLPEVPVGVGARWVVARLHAPGVLSVVVYELVSLRGTRGEVRFQLQVQRPGGVHESLVRGSLRFDLKRPLPESLEVLHTERTVPGAGMREETRTRVRLSPTTTGPSPEASAPATAR